MKRMIRQVVFLVTGLLVLGCWLHSVPFAQSDDKKPTDKPMEASKLFDDHCAKCHGKDGRAKTFRGKMVGARNLTDAKWQEKTTDEQITEAIKKGPGAMPSFEKKFSQAEIESLVAYVRHFKEKDSTPDKK